MERLDVEETARDMLDDSFSDIALKLEGMCGAKSGDISPEQSLRLDDLRDDIAKLLTDIALQNKEISVPER